MRESHDSDCKGYCFFGCDVMYSGRSSTEVSEEPAATITRFEQINSHTLTMVAAYPSMTSVHYYQTTCTTFQKTVNCCNYNIQRETVLRHLTDV